MERPEAIANLIQTLRARLSDEAIPPFGTPAHDTLAEAFRVVAEQMTHADIFDFGAASVRCLHANYLASVLAERSALVAETAARRGEDATR